MSDQVLGKEEDDDVKAKSSIGETAVRLNQEEMERKRQKAE